VSSGTSCLLSPDVTDPSVTRQAKRLVAGRCLIASDIDRTLLSHNADEASEFFRTVAPHLVHAAQMGTHVAVLSGNSVHQLVSRFLDLLVQELCHCRRPDLLGQFHFFCNGAGLYAHFPMTDPELRDLLEHPNDAVQATRMLDALRCRDRTGSCTLRPRFVNGEYLERCQLDSNPEQRSETEHLVTSILDEVGAAYFDQLAGNAEALAWSYDLSLVTTGDGFTRPHVDVRSIQHGTRGERRATVQMTLKPVLGSYMRLQGAARSSAGDDPRTAAVAAIQERLDSEGLGHIVARPGGRSSIDIALRKVDKAYALRYLIDRLNVQGQSTGERFGSQTIYFGDEVTIGTGNDYAVTRIPGLTVFAVNGTNHPAPFLSSVFVPSPTLNGPQATATVLQKYNEIAQEQIARMSRGSAGVHTAIDILKQRIFGTRIDRKISELRNSPTDITGDDWQGMHAYITLLSRQDPDARVYLAILRDLLDIMLRNDVEPRALVHHLAAGSSHPDWE